MTTQAQPCGESVRSFSINATALRQALLVFGRQSGCSIVFDPSTSANLATKVLRAKLPAHEALRRLLTDLPVQFLVLDGDIIVVTSRPAAAVPTPASVLHAPTPRLPRIGHIEDVVVTAEAPIGSRIRVADFTGFAQTDVITRLDMQRSGRQSVGEVLRFLPAVSGNSTSTLVTNGGDGTATVTLRGLPAENTLVLIDGHRTNPNGLTASSVDLNTLPLTMIERIEVLKDGASSAYGSDAIAGVVNIVTREHITGLEVDAYDGVTQRGDLATHQFNLAGGWRGDDLSLSWGASSYRQDEIKSRDRDTSRNADSRDRGGIDQRSSATPYSRVTVGDTPLIRLRPEELNLQSGLLPFRAVNTNDRYNFRETTSAVVPSQRWSVFAKASYQTDSVRLRFDVLRNHTFADNTLAPLPIFTAQQAQPLVIAADQPFNPFGVDLNDVRRRVVELGPRHGRNESDTLRTDLALDYADGSVNAALQLSYHRTDALERHSQLIDTERLRRALGSPADCTSPCVPVDILGGPGSITAPMLNYLAATARARGVSTLVNLTGDVSADIVQVAAGAIRAAGGFDVRRESIHTDPDALFRAGNALGSAAFGPTRGNRNVFEAYTEAFVPILRDLSGGAKMDASIAARVSNYSDFGTTFNPKFALRFRPSTGWLVRGAIGTGFRAPTLQQLFIADQQSFQFLNDPCANALNAPYLVGCPRASDASLTQFLTLTGGERHLSPEKSRTITLGLVWTPEAVPDLSLSVDYYRIQQHKVVDANAQYIVNQNTRFGRFPKQVVRDANGNIKIVFSRALNIGRRNVSGLDLAAKWQTPDIGLGNIEIAANGAYIQRFTDRLTPDTPSIDHAGTFSDEASSGNGALPHWKADAGVLWLRGDWEVRYNIFFVSHLTEVVPFIETKRTIKPWYSHSAQVSYGGSLPYDARVTIGVTNLFDRAPPFSAAAFNDSFDGRTYDLAGRYWYLRLNAQFE